MLEYQRGRMTIYPRFPELMATLRIAIEIGEGVLDKEATSHDELFNVPSNALQF